LIHDSEKSWNLLRKNFKELIRKLEKTKPVLLVQKYMQLSDEFKKAFSGVNEEIIFET